MGPKPLDTNLYIIAYRNTLRNNKHNCIYHVYKYICIHIYYYVLNKMKKSNIIQEIMYQVFHGHMSAIEN